MKLNGPVDGALAEQFRRQKRKDPFPVVPHALLAADDIKKYIFETGAITPFDPCTEGCFWGPVR